MVHTSGIVRPDPEKVPVYQKKYETWCAVRGALDTVRNRFEV